jgi:ABC-type Fe3+/spermidine/putrescine transport system ATPase subunit
VVGATAPDPPGAPAPAPNPAPEPIVELVGAVKTYGDVAAIDGVDLRIRPRELFTLLGPSGSGKTTILRAIAGLVDLTEGELFIEGRDVRKVPTYERNIGMVFQSLALFPHMTVFDNIAFPLRMRRRGEAEISRKVQEVLDVVRLPDIGQRRVHELSGGQQQRVALARALVYDPKLLLLDEPLGALDKRLREEMQLELVRLHGEIDVTIVNVTHDQVEALMLSDRIGVMEEGRIVQVGSPEEIYRRPATRFVAEFVGRANMIDGVGTVDGGLSRVETPSGVAVVVAELPDGPGRPHAAAIRAELITLRRPDEQTWPHGLRGKVSLRVFEGESVYYEVTVPGLDRPLRVASRRRDLAVDDAAVVEWDPAEVAVVATEGT